jgi:SAM-dependent methyltransferase
LFIATAAAVCGRPARPSSRLDRGGSASPSGHSEAAMDREINTRMRRNEREHWWFRGRRAIIRAAIGRLRLPAAARIAEIGCGVGDNLGLLAEFGRVVGVEPDEESRRYAAAVTGCEVRPGLSPADIPLPEADCDLVAAFDVLKHVEDDHGAVAALARLARPGGRLLTTVPAGPWMWSRHDELHHHKRRYTMAGYRRLFRERGLEIALATHFNSLLYPVIAGTRAVKKALGGAGADEDAIPPAWANRTLEAVFASERVLIGRTPLPVGVSILLAARRPV